VAATPAIEEARGGGSAVGDVKVVQRDGRTSP
jgi:hypothetical protein